MPTVRRVNRAPRVVCCDTPSTVLTWTSNFLNRDDKKLILLEVHCYCGVEGSLADGMFRAAMFRRALSSGNKLTQKSFFERILKSLSQVSSGEAEMERKAESQAILANVRKKLTHASTNYQTSNDIDTWTELDFPALTENQLMELAQYHFQGGKARNAELAVKVWKEASDRGNKDALYSYGACLRSGIGITKDPVHALEVLLKLAESHNNPFAHVREMSSLLSSSSILRLLPSTPAESCLRMGKAPQLICKRLSNIIRSLHIILSSFIWSPQKAANLGIPPAAYNLGNLYATGNGCEQSDEKAFHCFAVAANAGEKSAKYFYATYLCEGKGCTKDLELGIRTHV
jgi:TPR repeat protein